MGFPAKLKKMNLHLDGVGHSGEVAEVTVPKLTLKMDEWRGGGMLGPIQIDKGLEKLELEFTMGGLIDRALRRFGASTYDAVTARFSGAYQEDGNGRVRVVEITVLGRYSEIDLGSAKVGDDTNHKAKLACAYYQLDVDGQNWLTIDFMSNVFIVFGVDRYAEIRAAVAD